MTLKNWHNPYPKYFKTNLTKQKEWKQTPFSESNLLACSKYSAASIHMSGWWLKQRRHCSYANMTVMNDKIHVTDVFIINIIWQQAIHFL